MLKVDWDRHLYNKNADDCTSFFINKFERLLDEMAPVKRLSNKEMGLQQRPWITHEILELMIERDNIHKQYVTENDLDRKAVFLVSTSTKESL